MPCDMFVALPPATSDGCVIFGKNTDRPTGEVQEVIHVPKQDHEEGSKVMCTYIEVDQIPHTHAVILTKPAWMWGAEMGANEHGLCIGNVAVWSKLNGPDDLKEKLLGMDLIRLGLERSKTARESLDVITGLLGQYGQGGPCAEEPGLTKWAYHNSFLLVDSSEAWLLETVASHWAAEKLTGIHNVSNELTITTKFDLSSPGLEEAAEEAGLYRKEDGDFNFYRVFSEESSGGSSISPGSTRYLHGKRLLKEFASKGQIGVEEMCKILRDESSGINMSGTFTTMASHVSVLPPPGSATPPCHWFTATPNPSTSVFKPFIFCPQANIGDLTTSPAYGAEDPVRKSPRFQEQVDRKHPLYLGHENLQTLVDKDDPKGQMIVENLQELEVKCMEDMREMMKEFDEKMFMKVSQIFLQICNFELNFYKC
ncbi:secernin-3-like isoform X1 [Pecten maximus]|uniref:secernin-3-like isoform X1 n=1 Tax=Pecten maximus TaxID=6579 RepID=UPI001458C6EC|nr:secernin-3-like isoform X1 [Pecten maximus]